MKSIIIALLVGFLAAAPAHAQQSTTRSSSGGGRGANIAWTLGGAGIGFTAGVFIGLAKFDDAINSDRKVWTTAIAAAAAGGVLGYIVSRPRNRTSPSAAPLLLTPRGAHAINSQGSTLSVRMNSQRWEITRKLILEH